jgi:hypothetical protein
MCFFLFDSVPMILEVFDHTSGELVNSINETIENFYPEELYWKVCDTGILTFSFLTDFSYFPLKNKFRMLQDMVRTGQKWKFSKGGVDGFNYFPFIFSYFIFLPESSLLLYQ